MYHSPINQRSSMEEDGRSRIDSMSNSGVQPPYAVMSPTQAHFHSYSPSNGNHPSSTYNNYSSRPTSSSTMQLPPAINQSPRLGPPPSPTMNVLDRLAHINRSGYAAREPGSSTFYDPTTEHRESSATWAPSPYQAHSPIQVSIKVSLRQHEPHH
jgi:hypothetical protein